MTDMNKQNRLEDALKHALHRQDAPEDFTQRVMARVTAQGIASAASPRFLANRLHPAAYPLGRSGRGRRRHDFRSPLLHRAPRTRSGEAAKQRLMLALRVAGSKLQLAKAKSTR